jgi:hypothetical protein
MLIMLLVSSDTTPRSRRQVSDSEPRQNSGSSSNRTATEAPGTWK